MSARSVVGPAARYRGDVTPAGRAVPRTLRGHHTRDAQFMLGSVELAEEPLAQSIFCIRDSDAALMSILGILRCIRHRHCRNQHEHTTRYR